MSQIREPLPQSEPQEKSAGPLAPIRVRSLRDQVHDQLREAIITGRLESGLKVNERQLAAELGISSSPLKEALRQLEGEGLVRTEPRRGTFVSFSPRQAEEMNLARAALESIIARQAVKHGSDEQLRRLTGIIEEMRAAVETGSPEELIALNEKFHDAIHIASGCAYLRKLQNAQHMYNRAARISVLSQESVRRASFLEHEEIMRALLARDGDRAVEGPSFETIQMYPMDDTAPEG